MIYEPNIQSAYESELFESYPTKGESMREYFSVLERQAKCL